MPTIEPEIGCWDSVLLESLTEDAFINNLHQRYKRDHIYTYIGTFLVAINPFKPLLIYSPDQIQNYANSSLFKLPPHIYGFSNSTYQWLQDHSQDQCIILSGESNSGKTETSRLIVHFLTQVAEARRIAINSSNVNTKNNNSNTKTFSNETIHEKSNSFKTKDKLLIAESKNYTNAEQKRSYLSPKNRTKSLSSSSVGGVGGGRNVFLKKQNSIETTSGRKCSHEKTVDFDFSHHRSTENISFRCQKHNSLLASGGGGASGGCNSLLKQCSKHNDEFNRTNKKLSFDFSLKKSSNPELSSSSLSSLTKINTTIVEPHLLTCQKYKQQHNSNFTDAKDKSNLKSSQSKKSIISIGKSCTKCSKTLSTNMTNDNDSQCGGITSSGVNSQRCFCDINNKKIGTKFGQQIGNRLNSSIVVNKKILKSSTHSSSNLSSTPTKTTAATTILGRSDARSITSLDNNSIITGGSNFGRSITDLDHQNELCRIRDRIAQADVFLEAIGNATTLKNFNSSRFGKYFDIEFDYKGDPIAGHITHYMLEKSRVTKKCFGERNFHIFYQLLSGADIQFLKSLKLQRNIDKYDLLNHGTANEDDKNNFSYTKKSLETLGFGGDEIISIFKIIAVVIKLGNFIFVPTTNIDGTEGCQISNEYELFETAQLLNIDAEILINCLTRAESNWIQLDNGVELSAENATRTQLSLCRTLYGRLFTWIVTRINEALKSKYNLRGKNLGLLDFYGFEMFETNSFEQLAINYCDERLHQNCIRNILRYQQELYIREGLEWTKLDYFDNETICDLIDKPNYGILNLLDEPHINCDNAFLVRLQQCCVGHPDFQLVHHQQQPGKTLNYRGFQIRHFAGPVLYSVDGIVEKNSDILLRNISSGLYQSKLPLVQCLFPEGNPKRLLRKPTSLAATLRTQLSTLLQLAGQRKSHHVFCLKPNEEKLSGFFELSLIQHQVRYHSLMPLVALWRSGHCAHMEHQKFLQRYKLLNIETWPHPMYCLTSSATGGIVTSSSAAVGGLGGISSTPIPSSATAPSSSSSSSIINTTNAIVEAVAIIIRGLPLPAAEFTIGIRQVFIRSPRTVYELEEFRRNRLDYLACLIQKTYRRYSKRKWFLQMRQSQIIISSAWRTWRECRFGIPFTGRRHLWGLYKVAREEYRIQKYQKQVEWSVSVIQRQYVQWKRRQFLRTLPLRLPLNSLSPLCTEWTIAPRFLTETSQLLRNIYHRWRCYKYRRTFDQTARNRMREKVTASIIFKERKQSYARTVAHPFLGDYIRLRQNLQWKKISLESNDQYVVFADIINKIARTSGKFVPILLVLSTSSMLLLDQRTLQIKYRVPAAEIFRLSLSPYLDDIAVFHIKAEYNACSNQHICSSDTVGCLSQSEMGRKKGDFVFQTDHVIEIVTKLFLVIQNATSKPPEVHISTDFEANFGQQTVLFTFKCNNELMNSDSGGGGAGGGGGGGSGGGGSGGQQRSSSSLKVTRKGNRMEIAV